MILGQVISKVGLSNSRLAYISFTSVLAAVRWWRLLKPLGKRNPFSSSSDELSSADASPSSPPLPPVRPRRPPNRYSPSQYGLSVVSEPTSYRDAEQHPEW